MIARFYRTLNTQQYRPMEKQEKLIANTYAQIGRFWGGADVAQQVWKSAFQNITPVNFTYGRVERYLEVYAESETEQMPTYPQEGYIRQIGDTVVVKISDDYKDELTSAEEEFFKSLGV